MKTLSKQADNSIEVYLDKEIPVDNVKFGPDDMLRMTTKKNDNQESDVGYMRDYYRGVLTIDLSANAYIDNIAGTGIICINKNLQDNIKDKDYLKVFDLKKMRINDWRSYF